MSSPKFHKSSSKDYKKIKPLIHTDNDSYTLFDRLSRVFSKKTPDKLTKTSQKRQKDSVKPTQTPKKRTPNFKTIFSFLLRIIFIPLSAIFSLLNNHIFGKFKRQTYMQIGIILVFSLIIWRFADLQVFTGTTISAGKNSPVSFLNTIILPRRGQILIKDIGQNRWDIPVTSTISQAHVFFDAAVLQKQIESNVLTLETAALRVASALNIDYNAIYTLFKNETEKPEPPKYVIITKFVNTDQQEAVNFLREPTSRYFEGQFLPPFKDWLNIEQVETRFYPENELLASTIGFVPKHLSNRQEAINAGCRELVEKNEQRNTVNTFIPGDFSKGQYTIGYFGLEQRYCTLLAGLNGRTTLNRDIGTERERNTSVVHGANLYLTIDRNIQRKAEELLQQAVTNNTNAQGGPADGAILVMEVKTGRILAMASYPTFNPNNYTTANSNGFRNSVTSGDYEVGSVMKPLLVAAAMNEWERNTLNSNGERAGVPHDWTFEDYDSEGKPYQENNGFIVKIQNSQNFSYKDRGRQNLSNILRDSINTGIAEIQPTIGNTKTREYYREKFLFGEETLLSLPGDAHGNVAPLDKNIGSPYQYANFGFGQGFTISPLQLARAYTALANNGNIVEPVLVEKIVHDDGREETINTEGSVIQQPKPRQVLTENTARLVTGYLVNTVDQGYLGVKPSKGQVPGYTVAGKTGTAEVGRAPKVPCDYTKFTIPACNRAQGIYDHTYIGYGPERNPQILVLVKLSEPKPGEVSNFAENTLGPTFSQMMGYTLEYIGIPKEPGQ